VVLEVGIGPVEVRNALVSDHVPRPGVSIVDGRSVHAAVAVGGIIHWVNLNGIKVWRAGARAGAARAGAARAGAARRARAVGS